MSEHTPGPDLTFKAVGLGPTKDPRFRGIAKVNPDGTVTAEINTATSSKPFTVEIHRLPAEPDLIEWLRTQLDEDERVALAATPAPWRYDPTKVNAISREESVFAGATGQAAITVASTGPCDDPQSMADARFIAARDPTRALAEVKAKRAIIAGYEASYRQSDDYPGWEGAVYAIAQPYRDREGWRDEWSVRE